MGTLAASNLRLAICDTEKHADQCAKILRRNSRCESMRRNDYVYRTHINGQLVKVCRSFAIYKPLTVKLQFWLNR